LRKNRKGKTRDKDIFSLSFLFYTKQEAKTLTKTASTQSLQAKVSGQAVGQSTGVDPYKKAQSYLKAMLPAIAESLPKNSALQPERMARLCMTTLKLNPKLLECSIESLLGACLQASQLGLEPNLMGSCYLIPYKGQVSFQIGYRGLIDLACRNGSVLTIVAQEVRKGDTFHYEFGRNETLKHIPAPNHLRGDIEYVYAYAHMKNGGFTFQVMHISEIEKIRDQHSISYRFDKNNSIWAKHFEAMCYKTVIKKLIKYLPISVEAQNEISHDETVRKDISSEAIPFSSFDEDTVFEPKIEILDAQVEQEQRA
jgi:recombination protein RecT